MNNDRKLNEIVSNACVKSSQKVLAQIAKAKSSVLAQFRDIVADHEEVLRLALNEAEALAWQTQYPHLVFQGLAEEKARGVIGWAAHQQLILAPARVAG